MPERSATTRESFLLPLLAAVASIAALIFYYRHDAILLYGDALAHINIARRVFDSRWPGPGQLGTVWLPVPHVLMLPFVVSNWAWRTGLGASIPSMVGYVAGAVGIFRLVRRGLASVGADQGRARIAAWVAAVAYGANPNLLYMQATAMNEPLYLAFFVWAIVFFSEFVQALHGRRAPGARAHPEVDSAGHSLNAADPVATAFRALRWCGVMLLCAMLSRYDGWFAAAWFGAAALVILLVRWSALGDPVVRRVARNGFVVFVLLLAAGPAFWLGWNKFYFGDSLEWMTGPYSARAIMQRSMKRGEPPHPGYHSIKTAAVYYVKSAKLNLAGNNLEWGGARYGWPRRIENAWPVLAVAGSVLLLAFAPSLWPLLLLWVPLIFYTISIAYGGVPVFMPVWYPYSYYNVRYGLQMLPAAAVFLTLAFYFATLLLRNRLVTMLVWIVALVFLGVSYGSIWKSGPVCLHEPQANSVVRIALERRVGEQLRALPAGSTLLMQIGYYSGVLQRAGIPLKRTINETDFRMWQAALADPAAHADYLVAAGDDRVAQTARDHASQLDHVATFEAPDQPTVVIYRTRR